MRITDRPKNTSIWNKSTGWVCEPFPKLNDHEIALTIHVKSGLPQYDLEAKLNAVGLSPEYYHLGKNDVRLSRGSSLLYLVRICLSYQELSETLKLVESAGVPIEAVSVITPRLQQAILA